MATLLDDLRNKLTVDCDTLDSSVAQSLGPFVDCTSNQAIAAAELSDPKHNDLIAKSIQQAKDLSSTFPDATIPELAIDIMTLNLHAGTLPHLTGRVHVQTDPYTSYSTAKTISHAERIISLAHHLHPSLDGRVCIKIPSTWEGLQACRHLESKGVTTLATILYTIEQAALAAQVGCSYIAPYVNDLRVHFVPGYVDSGPGIDLTHAAKLYFTSIKAKTQVMPASLTSVDEILMLSGRADRITIAPHLLRQLATTSAQGEFSVGEVVPSAETKKMAEGDYKHVLQDEAAWRTAMTRGKLGINEKKLVDAINIFCDEQDRLVAMVQKRLEAAG
ncbi:Transaldolase/Fructose-6-phosphate aldolase-like protein [Elsinoe fawcettii]|nr:Transaldolase/Fructose-6-phosphate aldolase-like protein [Elsinoe fawcettii]